MVLVLTSSWTHFATTITSTSNGAITTSSGWEPLQEMTVVLPTYCVWPCATVTFRHWKTDTASTCFRWLPLLWKPTPTTHANTLLLRLHPKAVHTMTRPCGSSRRCTRPSPLSSSSWKLLPSGVIRNSTWTAVCCCTTSTSSGKYSSLTEKIMRCATACSRLSIRKTHTS